MAFRAITSGWGWGAPTCRKHWSGWNASYERADWTRWSDTGSQRAASGLSLTAGLSAYRLHLKQPLEWLSPRPAWGRAEALSSPREARRHTPMKMLIGAAVTAATLLVSTEAAATNYTLW